jgi:guanidinopropionase
MSSCIVRAPAAGGEQGEMAALNDDDRLLLEGTYWWGPATLFRCDLETDPTACDLALVGVPHSSGNGSTERDQHLGPRAVRHVSALQRRMHAEFGFSPWEVARIRDLGDVPLPEANNNEQCIERIARFFERIGVAGTRAVSIGGDHSVTGGILRGLAGESSTLTAGEPVALVHLDAHIDAYESLAHWFGARDSAAHWASYLVREGRVDPQASVQIGMRGNPRTASWLDPSYELGYEVVPMSRYRELGPDACVELIRARAGDRPIYVTFDLDCLDATVAPAAANLEPAYTGWTVDEAFGLLRGLRDLNVIGGDVVCLVPTKDSPNGITAMVAAAAMFEILSLAVDSGASRAAKQGQETGVQIPTARGPGPG